MAVLFLYCMLLLKEVVPVVVVVRILNDNIAPIIFMLNNRTALYKRSRAVVFDFIVLEEKRISSIYIFK